MEARADRWPAILSWEQEAILRNAGFQYDFEPGVLVNLQLRKVVSIEAAADRGAEELSHFAKTKRDPKKVEFVFGDARPPESRESLKKRYGW